ncbi:RNA-directed DNA polymerase from mobile element jockey [Trichonephila clavipes]|uniref:RNA-directed DNA polymerase from mobile element jockey n=1 Tax=Trichonephila clavipes TaxID=2585209 RepID=A0A8X6W5P3_TRICX|nr:RNA-directed DNA polymerase from mobile element jockey [Trichonephila clavipes]
MYDFPTSPTVEVCLFADDATILSQSRSPELVRKNLQAYLVKLKKWLTLWRISINTSIIFKKGNYKNKLNPLKLSRNPIPWCDEVQYLGVTLDKKLTYRNHILQTANKFRIKLHTLHRLLSRKSKLNLDKKSDEAHFWLNGYVNKQNCRIWSEANPQVYVETPLHPEKLTVWCALWAGGILLQKR